jgi:hypothetical protein
MGAVTGRGMKPQGRRGTAPRENTARGSQMHVQGVGLNAADKKVSALSRRRDIFLDIPFYRTFWRCGSAGMMSPETLG